jgi:hypothetical protein
MLHFIDNWSTILFILLIVDLTFPLLLVWFLGLCRTPEKATRNKSNELSVISRVPLILVSSIVKVQILWSTSPTPTGLEIVMIKIPLLAMCFTSILDHWCGHVQEIEGGTTYFRDHMILGGFSAHGFLPMVFYFRLRN